MNRLLNKMKNSKMCLIASIPENTYEMAKAAWEAGCDAIKVHMNVYHRASQNTFGSLEELRPIFERILKDSPVPVGIVVGENTFVCEKQFDEVVKMGFDFISLYGHHTPASFFGRNDINNFYSVNYEYSYEEINYISNSDFADMLEMSICKPETYGERLNFRDLIHYEYISKNSKIPTIVPTQRVVYPSDIKVLHKCGVKALMVGAVTMGKEINHISEVLKAFRAEIDKL